MVVEEKIVIDETEFVRHYSDAGMMIRKVGTDEEYIEAIDLMPCEFEYEETDKPITAPDTPISESSE